ncbi:MAG: hypothetical protein KDK07_10600 [Bauldia sp.]|nr:hypothetical protein [Bauldia sp.]
MCGAGVPPGDGQSGPGSCVACGADPQAIEIAAAILLVAGRGAYEDLSKLLAGDDAPKGRILDLTGDAALSRMLERAAGYRAGRIVRQAAGDTGTTPAGPFRLPVEDATATFDHLLLRNLLFCAEDPWAVVDEIARRLAPRGTFVLQEIFPWPIPAITAESPPGEDGVARTRPVSGGVRYPLRFEIGADVIDRFASWGVMAEFYRPGLALDPAYRRAVLVGERS